jgi:hypothetical protein
MPNSSSQTARKRALPKAFASRPTAAMEPTGLHDEIAPVPQIDRALNCGVGPAISQKFHIVLSAALMTVRAREPMVFLLDGEAAFDPRCLAGVGSRTRDTDAPMLPTGPLLPLEHLSLEHGVQALVAAQTGIDLGHTEQLYTFGEHSRVMGPAPAPGAVVPPADQLRVVSVGYLGLTAATSDAPKKAAAGGRWVSCYDVLPWEDWRQGRPTIIDTVVVPQLEAWARRPSPPQSGCHHAEGNDARSGELLAMSRSSCIDLAFGSHGAAWDEERVLERHDLMEDAGLISDARRAHGRPVARTAVIQRPADEQAVDGASKGGEIGLALAFGHRRILAMALGRLRAKIKYRPIVFDVMDEAFTLYELQSTVEAILGTLLHKQNFRRLVETTGLVEEVGDFRAKTGGRPAKLFRFQPHLPREHAAFGLRIRSMWT